MVKTILKTSLNVYVKRPFKFWGITLLLGLIMTGVSALFGVIPGIPVIVAYALSIGLAYIFLCGYKGEDVKASDLFVAFTNQKTTQRVVGGIAWRDLIIFLWSLIPVVGWIFAIIKSYSYALTPYILIKEPEIKATEAVKVSAARMKGYRGKMFWTRVFVVAVALLIGIAFGMLAYVTYNTFKVIGAIMFVVLLAYVVVTAISLPIYMQIITAGFYKEIMAKQNDAE